MTDNSNTVHTIPELWRQTVSRHADLDAIKMRGEPAVTYAEVERRSAAMARGLVERGAGKGSRIGLLLPNGPDWLVGWLAASRIGAIPVALSTLFSARELRHVIRNADLSVVMMAKAFLRNDYVARMEEAFPGIVMAKAATGPLSLVDAPYLREVWTTERAGAAWTSGTIDDLEHLGEASPLATRELLAAQEEQVSPADLGLLIYTSGSTSYPKGILHTQGVIVRKTIYCGDVNTLYPSNLERGDRAIVPSPFFWVGGFLTLTCALYRGACIIVDPDMSAVAMVRAIRSEKATLAGFTPSQHKQMESLEDCTPELLAGLKPLNPIQRQILNTDPSVPTKQIPSVMGMTETLAPHSGEPDGALLPPDMAGSVGRPLNGMERKLIDPETGEPVEFGQPGELCVRGWTLMEGMYKRERSEVFDADGFYHTGDLCEERGDRHLFFHSRLGGMIKTSGANVSPDEVEEVIREAAGVVEAAVFGVPDEALGHLLAAVVATDGRTDLDEAFLKGWVKERLSSFKVPRKVIVCRYEDIPRTGTDKIHKPGVLERFGPLIAGGSRATGERPEKG